MGIKVDSRGSQTLGVPADQIAALFDRYKLALIGLATIGVIVVSVQLLLVETNVVLALQLFVAILLWGTLVLHMSSPKVLGHF